MSKRIISLMLALLLTVSFAACSNNPEETADTDSSAQISGTVEEEEEYLTEVEVAGPDIVDLNGYNFRFLTSNWRENNKKLWSEELNGEVINDAVYNSNLSVMDNYNCVFVPVIIGSIEPNDVANAVASSVKAGADDYDISFNHDNVTVGAVMNGYYLNLRRSDVFNFDAPWWTHTKDSFTIGDGMYFAANYITYNPIYFAFALTYNKEIAENLGIEIPYQEIFAGNWYLDDLIEMTKDANMDLNGDGKMKIGDDQYGFVSTSLGLVPFQVSLGVEILGKDSDGYIVPVINEEKMYEELEKFERLMENGYNDPNDWDTFAIKYFADGKVLFSYPEIFCIPAAMHDTDVKFGTIPVPKLDENQAEYISGSYDTYWGIPKTGYSHLDTTAVILEAMGHSCFYSVLPAVYETTLEVKFSESPNDAQTYEIIRDSICVDIGYAFKDVCGVDQPVYALANYTKDNLSANLKKLTKVISKSTEKVNKKFAEFNSEVYG